MPVWCSRTVLYVGPRGAEPPGDCSRSAWSTAGVQLAQGGAPGHRAGFSWHNSPDVFLRTYCPEGLSRLTRQEEEERAGREADLDEVATNLDQESEQDGSPSDDGTPSDESTPSDVTTPSDDTTPSCTDVDEDDEEETIEHARKQKRRRRH